MRSRGEHRSLGELSLVAAPAPLSVERSLSTDEVWMVPSPESPELVGGTTAQLARGWGSRSEALTRMGRSLRPP